MATCLNHPTVETDQAVRLAGKADAIVHPLCAECLEVFDFGELVNEQGLSMEIIRAAQKVAMVRRGQAELAELERP